MEVSVDHRTAFAETWNGAEAQATLLLHGAGLDHRMWEEVGLALAAAGRRVLALDLPGHGRSGGNAPEEIVEAAAWVRRFLDAAGIDRVALVGFSMGALVALETTAQAPDRVRSLVLAGVAERMPVHPKLLAAAAANGPTAFDMIANWGHHYPAFAAATKARLAAAGPGVLHAGLSACDRYQRALEAVGTVRCPVLLLLAANDQMTPAKLATPLADAPTGAGASVTTVVLPDCGHMMMSEAPAAAVEAMRPFV